MALLYAIGYTFKRTLLAEYPSSDETKTCVFCFRHSEIYSHPIFSKLLACIAVTMIKQISLMHG